MLLAWVLYALAPGDASAFARTAFPGAAGYGRYTVGGRGGTVYRINTLSNCDGGTVGGITDCTGGEMSLRKCAGLSGPRICVFDVSGTIEVDVSPIIVSNPYLTIAGQTSPNGVQLKIHHGYLPASGSLISITASEVVIQYLRLRPGVGCDTHDYTPAGASGCAPGEKGYSKAFDGISLSDSASSYAVQPHHVMFDHLSISWSTDEAVQTWAGESPEPSNSAVKTRNFTIQNSILDPHLDVDGSTHAMGYLNAAQDMSFIRNLCVAQFRCLYNTGYGVLDAVNNVMVAESPGYNGAIGHVYRPTTAAECGSVGADWNHVPLPVMNARSNWGAQGWTPPGYTNHVLLYMLCANGGIYDDGGNVVRVTSALTQMVESGSVGGSDTPSPTEFEVASAYRPIAMPATQAKAEVLATAGASRRLACAGGWVAVRDTVDAALVANAGADPPIAAAVLHPLDLGGWPDLATGAPSPCADTDADGMPDAFESAYSVSDSNADADGDGWSNLEEYLSGQSPTAANYPW